MESRLITAARGGAAGLVATAGMSAFMIAVERLGIMPGQPPRMIVDRLAPGLREDVADRAALVSHGAYGMVAGAAFALLTAGRPLGPKAGAAYGFLIWAGGYEGWVPMMGVLPPAHRDHPPRVAVMVTAHLIYGYLLGRQLGTR